VRQDSDKAYFFKIFDAVRIDLINAGISILDVNRESNSIEADFPLFAGSLSISFIYVTLKICLMQEHKFSLLCKQVLLDSFCFLFYICI